MEAMIIIEIVLILYRMQSLCIMQMISLKKFVCIKSCVKITPMMLCEITYDFRLFPLLLLIIPFLIHKITWLTFFKPCVSSF